MQKNQGIRVGDVGRVKPGVKDQDFDIDMGGWQGRVSEISPLEDLIRIDWDSLTLMNMPGSMIARCEEEGLGWEQFYLEPGEVEPATARDTAAEVAKTVRKLQEEHAWDYLGEAGNGIARVLAEVKADDEWAAFLAWDAHLRQVLRFPFAAEVAEYQEHGPLRAGDKVEVQRITDVVDMYGVIVAVRHKRGSYHFPLCDLEATDKGSANHGFVQEYAVWFANR